MEKENEKRIPTNLKHKPVVAVENYAQVDGRLAGGSDAAGLSLGLAQWNDRGKVDLSAKVWRYTGEKWSRQSEELPLHRVLDLALLICQTQLHFREAYRYEKLYNEQKPVLARLPVQGGAMTVEICSDNPLIDEDIALFRDTLARDDELISERLALLSQLLKELGYGLTPWDEGAK